MIICECGHGIEEHDSHGCQVWLKHEYFYKTLPCQCTLSASLIEARYWARRMMKERDELQLELDLLKTRFNIQELAINNLGIQAGEQFERAQENDKNAAYWAGMWAAENKECNKLQEQTIEMWTIEEFVKYKKQLEIAEEAIKKARTVVAEKHHKEDTIYLKPNLVAYEILDNALAEINKEGG
jgi:hypothetical protein